MKRTIKFFFAVVIIGVAGLGVYTSANFDGKNMLGCVLYNLESIARGEIPEVEIACGSSDNKGRCWAGDCEPFYTPFGFAKAWDCYIATGNTNDVCVQDAPCI